MIDNNEINDFDEGEDDLSQSLEVFGEAVIWGTDWTTETVISQLKRKNIDLNPKFQRRDAWSKSAKSKFIESLILGLPIPPIILAENRDRKGSYTVIDGKQRLLTIRQFFAAKENDEFNQLKISGLKILTDLNGKTIKHLESNPNLNVYFTQLSNQTIRTIVIRNWPNENFLYTVFLRLNTGSVKLSPQELRQALNPGEFIDFADSFSLESTAIKKMLGLKEPDYRMRDVEIVIRYFTFKYFIESYTGNLKAAFDNTVKKLNESWDLQEGKIKDHAKGLEEAINFTINAFGEKEAFSKWNGTDFQKNFNRAIFDIMVYYFSNDAIRDLAHSKKTEIVEAFKRLCDNDADFLTSFEHTTKSLQNTAKRLETWGNCLSEVLSTPIDIPVLNKETNRFTIKRSQ
jgi:hypothetical protein